MTLKHGVEKYRFKIIRTKKWKNGTLNFLKEMCLMNECGADALSEDPEKQRKAIMIKIFGAVSALIISLVNMFISGFAEK